jgi:predicted SAM-dependent methyltransferase
MEKIKLHLGCGDKKIKGWVNIDIQNSPAVDLISDCMDLPYSLNSVSTIYSCCMLEHFGRNNNLKFFRHTCWKDVLLYWYSLLKPGGELYISVPDFEAVCREYLKNKNILKILGITLGGQKNEEDLHGMIYDYELLSTELKSIGFNNIMRYDWRNFEAFQQKGYDDFSASYIPHMDFDNGRLMMLNIKAVK